MSMIVVLVMSSLVTLVAVIGLADAVTHLLCGLARSLKAANTVGLNSPPANTSRHLGQAS